MPTLALLGYVAVGTFLRVVVDPEADPLAATSIPWWAQVGLNTSTVGALVAFFAWQNRQISNGKWYPSSIVDKMIAEKDVTIADKDKQLASQGLVIDEQSRTIRAQESTISATVTALKQATSNRRWLDVLLQKTLGIEYAPAVLPLEDNALDEKEPGA